MYSISSTSRLNLIDEAEEQRKLEKRNKKIELVINTEDTAKRKVKTQDIVKLFENFNPRRAEKIRSCANLLVYKVNLDNYDRKLAKANFCKDMFCIECAKRKSNFLYHNLHQIMKEAKEKYNQEFAHMTLALENSTTENLNKGIDKLLYGFKLMMKRAKFVRAFEGYFRSLEITYNEEEDTYHVHLHVIVSFNKNEYFDKKYKKYISHDTLVREFATATETVTREEVKSMKLKDIRVTSFIKKIYDKNDERIMTEEFKKVLEKDEKLKYNDRKFDEFSNAISESAKYVTKFVDILDIKDEEKKVEVLKVLSEALFKRRKNSYGRLFKELARKLKIQEFEDLSDDEIIHADDSERDNYKNYIYAIMCYNFVAKKYELKATVKEYEDTFEKYIENKKEIAEARRKIDIEELKDSTQYFIKNRVKFREHYIKKQREYEELKDKMIMQKFFKTILAEQSQLQI